jgi:uncharacterized protein
VPYVCPGLPFPQVSGRLTHYQYESHDVHGQWWRSYGNELWEFDEHGLMRRREASINDISIEESQRRIFGPRPASERGVEFPLQ